MHSYTPDDLCAQFNEIGPFSLLLAESLVHEIRRRANNESTNVSAASVYEFLRAYPADSRGWVLLKSLNFVVSRLVFYFWDFTLSIYSFCGQTMIERI